MFDVISIGAATVDIFIRSKQFIVTPEIIGLTHSSKSEISDSLITSGGGATNSSVSFSRLSLKSACISLLGKEPLSEYVTADLKKNHVATGLLSRSIKENTDFSVILVAPDGGRSILTQRGTTFLREENIKWDRFKKTKWLYITSLEGNLDLLEKLIGFASEHHQKIALNPGSRELSQLRRLHQLLPRIDFLLLNKTESQQLLDLEATDSRFWTRLAHIGPKIISVTYGRLGAYVITPNEKLYSPIINVNPVDETGAGDSFGSAFIAAQIYGLTLSQSLTWGIKNSASVVSFLGAKAGLLSYKQITG